MYYVIVEGWMVDGGVMEYPRRSHSTYLSICSFTSNQRTPFATRSFAESPRKPTLCVGCLLTAVCYVCCCAGSVLSVYFATRLMTLFLAGVGAREVSLRPQRFREHPEGRR